MNGYAIIGNLYVRDVWAVFMSHAHACMYKCKETPMTEHVLPSLLPSLPFHLRVGVQIDIDMDLTFILTLTFIFIFIFTSTSTFILVFIFIFMSIFILVYIFIFMLVLTLILILILKLIFMLVLMFIFIFMSTSIHHTRSFTKVLEASLKAWPGEVEFVHDLLGNSSEGDAHEDTRNQRILGTDKTAVPEMLKDLAMWAHRQRLLVLEMCSKLTKGAPTKSKWASEFQQRHAAKNTRWGKIYTKEKFPGTFSFDGYESTGQPYKLSFPIPGGFPRAPPAKTETTGDSDDSNGSFDGDFGDFLDETFLDDEEKMPI